MLTMYYIISINSCIKKNSWLLSSKCPRIELYNLFSDWTKSNWPIIILNWYLYFWKAWYFVFTYNSLICYFVIFIRWFHSSQYLPTNHRRNYLSMTWCFNIPHVAKDRSSQILWWCVYSGSPTYHVGFKFT